MERGEVESKECAHLTEDEEPDFFDESRGDVDEDGKKPPLRKKDSYVRRDKHNKSVLMPKILTRKRSEAKQNKGKSRRSIANLLKAIGAGSFLAETVSSELNPFAGIWKSDDVDGSQGFLEELEVSDKYKKLAAKYAGSAVQILNIVQDGDFFEITSNNDRRTVIINFQIGTPFYSENERGETTTCVASWESVKAAEAPPTLVIRARTSKSSKEVIWRRQVRDGVLHEESYIDGAKDDKRVRRLYQRVKLT